jgi:ABC-2 type transport system permease protein
VPVTRDVMGLQVQELRMVPYPLWVDVRSSGMAEGDVVVSGLPSVTLQWASPLELEEQKGVESTVLLQSSEEAWTKATTEVQPDFGAHPEHGFAVPAADQMKRRPLAVTLRGVFSSAFEGKASPLLGGGGGKPPPEQKDDKRSGPKGSSVLERSPESARLAVVGSSDFISDDVLTIARQTGPNNLQLLQNLVDWAVADVDLLSIRSRGTFARTLEPLDDGARGRWELINYALVVVALGLLVGGVFIRRRRLEPMTLTDPKDEGV